MKWYEWFDNKYTVGFGQWFEKKGYFRYVMIIFGLLVAFIVYKNW